MDCFFPLAYGESERRPIPGCGLAPIMEPVAVMPQPLTTTMPSMPSVPVETMAPRDLIAPLPSIVNTAPSIVPQAAPTSFCGVIEDFVSHNPLLSAALLAGVAYMTLKDK